jgi:hypothetical protein
VCTLLKYFGLLGLYFSCHQYTWLSRETSPAEERVCVRERERGREREERSESVKKDEW